MGFLDRFFGKMEPAAATVVMGSESAPSSNSLQPDVVTSCGIFVPSNDVVATEAWARKLVSYARRVSTELQASRVETWPDNNFWVVAADVYEATWHVPVTNRFTLQQGWMREGSCSGKALLLLTDGTPLQAEFVGHFNFNEPCLNFTYENSNVDAWRTCAWGSNNFASWRDQPGRGYGRVTQAKRQEFWDGRWNYKGQDEKPPGLGTSLALKRFLETHKTQLPKYY
jgi:hypothetical protein